MDFTSGVPTSWASDSDINANIAFDFDPYANGTFPIDGVFSRSLPLSDHWTSTDEPTCVNPEHLRLDEAPASKDAGISGGQLPCDFTSNGNLPASIQPLSALDEFLVSQGGWRPAVPCDHCRRLRLQCLMLQTTQDNPNPIESCSSCVGLYRHCSLAGPAKRQASRFETPRPVIGQLHGVYEDDTVQPPPAGGDLVSGAGVPKNRGKRSSSKSNTGTRPLRIWFNAHLDNPYLSESAKDDLCRESGLSRTQVSNWFGNARRRKKHSEQATSAAGGQVHRQGSPMPVSMISQMTPFERWQHSPPEDDPANLADIEGAMQLSSGTSSLCALQQLSDFDRLATNTPDCASEVGWLSLPASVDSSLNAASSCTSQQSFGDHSTSSKRSLDGTGFDGTTRKRRQRSEISPFECTNCTKTFTRKSDKTRHDRAIHRQPNERWVCQDLISQGESPLVWKISAPVPSCAFCGHESPDQKHFLSHEFIACADRSLPDRTFARKDHLRQHLYKFHKCRKWDGWNFDERVERLRRCGDG
jgi:hypothetical protein